MRRFLLLLILIGGLTWSYFWYVRGIDLTDRLRSAPPVAVSPIPPYEYVRRVGIGPHWERGVPMITPRQNVAAGAVGETIYVLGGIDGFGRTVRKMESFNVKSGQWSTEKDMPVAVTSPTVLVHGKKLYVFGGLVGFARTPVRTVQVYDAESGQWSLGNDLPYAMGAAGGAFDGSAFHLLGGVGVGSSMQQHLAYDVELHTYTSLEPLVSGRDHLGAALLNNVLYAAGGRAGNLTSNISAVEALSLAAGSTWDQRASLPVKRSGHGIAVIDGKIYVFGGEAATAAFGETYAYDPAKDAWQPSVSMPTPRHGFGHATVGGRIYVFGGGQRTGFSVSDVVEVFTP